MTGRLTASLVAVLAAFSVAGCASTYTLDGRKYESAESLTRACSDLFVAGLAATAPLPQPVSSKQLTIILPTRDFYMETLRYINRVQFDRTVSRSEVESDPAVQCNFEELSNMAEMIVGRGIYASANIVRADSLTSPQPSEQKDYLQLTLPSRISQGAQWYFFGGKTGKQAVSIDQGAGSRIERVNSLTEALTAAAIQNRP